jgi:hypothetical protein
MRQKGGLLISDFPALRKAFVMEKPVLLAVTICRALSVPSLYSVQKRVPDVLPVVFFRIVESVMQSAAFFSA